jgi:hypothetical protein
MLAIVIDTAEQLARTIAIRIVQRLPLRLTRSIYTLETESSGEI